MPYKFPSLSALKSFEAAVRHNSFSKAANELCLTHSAISHQIKFLEEFIGVKLFERRNKQVIITHQGRMLYEGLITAFNQLEKTLASVKKEPENKPLVISCEPTITMKWLIPKLAKFYELYPDITLHIMAAGGAVDFARNKIDIAFRRDDFNIAYDINKEHIIDELIGPVCSPKLIENNILNLDKINFLHTKSRLSAWQNWSDISGNKIILNQQQCYEHFYLSIQAATAGLGVAIASIFMVEEELKDGRLIAPFGFVKDNSSYVLISKEGSNANAEMSLLTNWIKTEIASTLANIPLI